MFSFLVLDTLWNHLHIAFEMIGGSVNIALIEYSMALEQRSYRFREETGKKFQYSWESWEPLEDSNVGTGIYVSLPLDHCGLDHRLGGQQFTPNQFGGSEVIASWGYAIHAIMPLVALKLGHGSTCLEGFPILVVPLSSTFIHKCLKIELL